MKLTVRKSIELSRKNNCVENNYGIDFQSYPNSKKNIKLFLEKYRKNHPLFEKRNSSLQPIRIIKRLSKKDEEIILKKAEKNWNTHFHLMWSKDNEIVSKSKRELFDSPLIYNINGTKKF